MDIDRTHGEVIEVPFSVIRASMQAATVIESRMARLSLQLAAECHQLSSEAVARIENVIANMQSAMNAVALRRQGKRPRIHD